MKRIIEHMASDWKILETGFVFMPTGEKKIQSQISTFIMFNAQ